MSETPGQPDGATPSQVRPLSGRARARVRDAVGATVKVGRWLEDARQRPAAMSQVEEGLARERIQADERTTLERERSDTLRRDERIRTDQILFQERKRCQRAEAALEQVHKRESMRKTLLEETRAALGTVTAHLSRLVGEAPDGPAGKSVKAHAAESERAIETARQLLARLLEPDVTGLP